MARTRRESIIFQAKASIQEANRIGTSKRNARKKGEIGIHSFKQFEHVISAAMNFLKYTRSTFDIKRMESLQVRHVIAYFNDMKERHLSDGHIRNVETALRQLQKGYILRQERLNREVNVFMPKDRLITFSKPLVRNRAYSDDEYKRILKRAKGFTKIGIQLMRELGLRVKEAANVRVEHFCLDDGILHIVDGCGITKGGRHRTVPIPRRFLSDLQRMLRDKSEKECVCNLTNGSLQQSFRRSCRKAEVDYIGRGCHGLRHAYARERVSQLMNEDEQRMLQRVLINRSKGRKADYGILSVTDKSVFSKMLFKMNAIHEELGHGKNRYDLAAIYMKD